MQYEEEKMQYEEEKMTDVTMEETAPKKSTIEDLSEQLGKMLISNNVIDQTANIARLSTLINSQSLIDVRQGMTEFCE